MCEVKIEPVDEDDLEEYNNEEVDVTQTTTVKKEPDPVMIQEQTLIVVKEENKYDDLEELPLSARVTIKEETSEEKEARQEVELPAPETKGQKPTEDRGEETVQAVDPEVNIKEEVSTNESEQSDLLSGTLLNQERASWTKDDLYVVTIPRRLPPREPACCRRGLCSLNRRHQCSCGRIFGDEAGLRQHRRYAGEHGKGYPWRCGECGSRYTKLSFLKFHCETDHPEDTCSPSSFSCPQCPASFKSPWRFGYHREEHDHRPVCEVCAEDYHSEDRLFQHQRFVHGMDVGRPLRADVSRTLERLRRLAAVDNLR